MSDALKQVLQMEVRLTPENFSANKIRVNGNEFDYRCDGVLEAGDKVRMRHLKNNVVLLEKVKENRVSSEA